MSRELVWSWLFASNAIGEQTQPSGHVRVKPAQLGYDCRQEGVGMLVTCYRLRRNMDSSFLLWKTHPASCSRDDAPSSTDEIVRHVPEKSCHWRLRSCSLASTNATALRFSELGSTCAG